MADKVQIISLSLCAALGIGYFTYEAQRKPVYEVLFIGGTLRENPGTDSAKIADLPPDTLLRSLCEKDESGVFDYYKVRTSDGLEGWVDSISIKGESEEC